MTGELGPGPEHQETVELPRLYVASLSDYNAGLLHGTWLTLDGDEEALWAGINAMLATSPTAQRWGEPAEEWAIHDYEGWGDLRLSEYEDLGRLSRLAGHVARDGQPFLAWADLIGLDEATTEDAAERFAEAYQGEFDSPEAYGWSLVEDFGFDLERLPGIPEVLFPYVSLDVEGWVRDMGFNGEVEMIDSKTGFYVFLTGV